MNEYIEYCVAQCNAHVHAYYYAQLIDEHDALHATYRQYDDSDDDA